MKYLLLLLFKFHLKIIYFFVKFLPVKDNKILLMSRQSNDISIDFLMIKKYIEQYYPNYKVVVLSKKIEKSIKGLFSYYFHLYIQMFHIATTNICIIDTYIIPISLLKHKKNLRVYQIWHAMGTVKKFGHQTLGLPGGKDKKTSLLMNMHKGYTNIICGSCESKSFFAEAFNYSEEKIIPNDLPRIDYLLKEKENIKRKIYKIYPNLKNKKNILYVPTFRKYKNDKIGDLIDNIDFSKYNLILKSHPVEKFDIPNIDKFKYDKFSSLEMLCIADFIITDYSTISIESTILNIPLYFYIFDYEKYKSENGLNVDVKKEMPNVSFENARDLIKCIEKNEYDFKIFNRFKKKYLYKADGKGTKRLLEYVIKAKK